MSYAALLRCTAVFALVAGCAASQPTPTCPEPPSVEAPFPAGQTQNVTLADAIQWGPCPPSLPAGCEMAVLEGNPKEEKLFTARFRITSPMEMKPHWHPKNERVTILEGKVGVGFGDTVDREALTWFGPGDYYVNAKEAHHFVVADDPVILQITGIGPWKVNYLDAE